MGIARFFLADADLVDARQFSQIDFRNRGAHTAGDSVRLHGRSFDLRHHRQCRRQEYCAKQEDLISTPHGFTSLIPDRQHDPSCDKKPVCCKTHAENGFYSPRSHRRRTSAHRPDLIDERADSQRKEQRLELLEPEQA